MSDLAADLARIYPPDRLLTRAATLAPYESDGLTSFRARPRAVVLAETKAEVVQTVRLCHAAGVPFVARGSGTSLSGGSVPLEDGIVIALNRMNRILRVEPLNRLAVVEPGVINLDISAAGEPHGLYYAPDPSSQSVCTIGGNVAFNSGGAHCFRHGMTANHVLGLEVVLPDGEVVRLGGDSVEEAGPDLTGLFVGSEGLFGVAVEITVRLIPRPEAYRTVLASYASLQGAGDAVTRIIAAGLLPGAMEIMDRLAIEAAEAAVHAGYPRDAAAVLLVELEGDREQADAELGHLMAVLDASQPSEVRVAANADERALLWKGRKCAFSAVGRISPDFIVQDGVVPRTQAGRGAGRHRAVVDATRRPRGQRVPRRRRQPAPAHPLRRPRDRCARARRGAGRRHPAVVHPARRSITGEHGVGLEKRAFLPEMFRPEDIAFMHRLRQSIDGRELANRGKMLAPLAAP